MPQTSSPATAPQAIAQPTAPWCRSLAEPPAPPPTPPQTAAAGSPPWAPTQPTAAPQRPPRGAARWSPSPAPKATGAAALRSHPHGRPLSPRGAVRLPDRPPRPCWAAAAVPNPAKPRLCSPTTSSCSSASRCPSASSTGASTRACATPPRRSDVTGTSARGPGLGHCSAGPGLHPAATSCTCRRKSQGKLDLFSTKDSYHPMAEYPPYQSHGRYVSPNSKPNPYSQVRAKVNGAGAGTFTYTNPTPTSDNL
uniref:Uncharacterized protein n=1 Tax=Otus sunia TaxID=257818 RepID=A0A8C8B401_9STRI